jgi:outer membrane receptor protein involved in Fe transport
VGLLWAPVESLSFRGTYGTSFRAPSLTQLDPTSAAHYLFGLEIGGAPGTILALASYATPQLAPETAETFTVGFDFRSAALPGFRLNGTYYRIDYTDRIGLAPTGGLSPFENPSLLPDVIYRPPSAAFIEEQLRASPLFANLNTTGIDLADPHAAAAALFTRPDLWIYDRRDRNLALSEQHGFDLCVSQNFPAGWGETRLGADITHILSYKQQGSPNSAVLSAIDIPGQPTDWRGRAYAGVSRGAFDGAMNVNYIDEYLNPWVTGSPSVGSWTTVDLNLAYDFAKRGSAGRIGPRLSLSVQNLFDEDPPFLDSGSAQAILSPIGFDPANANPLGRVIALGLAQKW